MNKEEYHMYSRNARSVFVYRYHDTNSWGCEYYENQLVDGEHKKVFIAAEQYPQHSERWAEDCADNYVFGIKSFPNNKTTGE